MRRLALRRDVLAPLTDTELGEVVGGQQTNVCALTNPCVTPAPYTGLRCLLSETCA